MSGFGHNGGPTMEPGQGWRKHCWGKARRDLLPHMPLQIVRIRVNRAKELGLPYKTYATVRASTGRDIVAFLFSSNALRLVRAGQGPEADRVAKLKAVTGADRALFVAPPMDPATTAARLAAEHDLPFAPALAAPGLAQTWSEMRDRVKAATAPWPSDGVLVIGDTALERRWSDAGKLAGYLPADRYFETPTA